MPKYGSTLPRDRPPYLVLQYYLVHYDTEEGCTYRSSQNIYKRYLTIFLLDIITLYKRLYLGESPPSNYYLGGSTCIMTSMCRMGYYEENHV